MSTPSGFPFFRPPLPLLGTKRITWPHVPFQVVQRLRSILIVLDAQQLFAECATIGKNKIGVIQKNSFKPQPDDLFPRVPLCRPFRGSYTYGVEQKVDWSIILRKVNRRNMLMLYNRLICLTAGTLEKLVPSIKF